MKPINDYVIIEPEKQTSTQGGIIIPDVYTEDSGRGTVLLTSDKVEELKPGDRVMWDKFYGAGFRFDFEGREIIALHEKDVWVKI